MQSILKMNSVGGSRPPAAVEIAPEGVLAAARVAAPRSRGAAAAEQEAVYAFTPLPAGAVVPSLEEPNLRSPEAVSAAIRSALSQVSPRTNAVTVVLPDTLVRVFVLDFDSLPAKLEEAKSVVRFRLRKMVPFEVEEAGVSFQVLAQDKETCKVLAAVMPGEILAEYESAVRAAGFEPGALLSTSLAALEAASSMQAVMTAYLSALSLTTCIANGQDLMLYRTLDLPEDETLRMMEVQRGVAVAAAYFEDKLGMVPQQILYAGVLSPIEFAQSIRSLELNVVEWVPRPEAGAMTALPQTSFAGVAGALAGAR
jgi:type IV pilus assembly protein PilM